MQECRPVSYSGGNVDSRFLNEIQDLAFNVAVEITYQQKLTNPADLTWSCTGDDWRKVSFE